MADPLSIIGAVGAVANIVDLIAKSIKSVHELHNRWKEADVTLLNLMAQLIALRAALTEIKKWMIDDLTEDPHHQLVMDLDVAVKCCQLLMAKMDILLGGLRENTNGPLDFEGTVMVVFKGNNMESIAKMIDRQVQALNLLLSACTW
jgi:guanine nucleotide-binding protein G(i) subunit alpha